jgi:negative regulator of sigma E activity
MKTEQQLELQAYLDGELAALDAQRVAASVAQDSEAQRLLEELRLTRAALKANETVVAVPESREFYWTKIEREIQRSGPADERVPAASWWHAWRRYLIPASAAATAALVCLLALQPGSAEDPLRHLTEGETLDEHTTSIAFHSAKENIYVVWISNKPTDQDGQPDSEWDHEFSIE